MRHFSRALALSLALVLSLAAFAPSYAAGTNDDLAQRKALAVRCFRAAHLDTLVRTMMRSMSPVLVAEELKKNPNMSAADRARAEKVIGEALDESLADIMPDYMDAIADVYAKTFTADELAGLVAFYEGPVGQAFVQKSPEMAQPVAQVVSGMIPRMQGAMKRHVCEKLGCGTPASTAS